MNTIIKSLSKPRRQVRKGPMFTVKKKRHSFLLWWSWWLLRRWWWQLDLHDRPLALLLLLLLGKSHTPGHHLIRSGARLLRLPANGTSHDHRTQSSPEAVASPSPGPLARLRWQRTRRAAQAQQAQQAQLSGHVPSYAACATAAAGWPQPLILRDAAKAPAPGPCIAARTSRSLVRGAGTPLRQLTCHLP